VKRLLIIIAFSAKHS